VKRVHRPGAFLAVLLCWLSALVAPASAKTPMQEYVEAMQPGWNLGNTLDATPNETAWGNPPTTQALIQQIAAQGFKSIRIPVTWDTGGRVGPAPTYTIDPAFLDRVQQIVDWSLDAGLYVMLNLHHDSSWIRSMPASHDAVLAKFNALWSQIAPRFRDYPDKLHFESINEPEFTGADDATQIALLDELNISFFQIVRGTGGGNATRPLVLPTLRTNNSQQYLDALKATFALLNDPNLIATVHEYGFWPFAVNITGVTKFEGAAKNWTTAGLDRVYNTLVAAGIPVIVGELGLLDFSRVDEAVQRGEALQYFEYVMSYFQSRGMAYQWWDAGGFFNRSTFQWNTPELYTYMMACAVGSSSTAATDLVFVPTGAAKDVSIPLNLNGNIFVSLTNGGNLLTPGLDYTLNGNVLTLKASLLAPYASGGYGVKAVLDANFSSGVPWKLFVRHHAAPALGAASGSKAVDLVIPASFNGDRLATMEAKYVAAPGYPYPGPADWTAFKLYREVYQPNYGNNTITIKKEFFAATSNEPVDLTFHFWSGRKVNYRLTFQPGGDIVANPVDWIVYTDTLTGWNDWSSWATRNMSDPTVVQSGTAAISVSPGAWAGVVLTRNSWESPFNTSVLKTLVFWVHGGTVGGQRIGVTVSRANGTSGPWTQIPLPLANAWRKIELPLVLLGVEGASDINRITFQNGRGETAPTFYIDAIKFTTAYPSDMVFVNGAPAPVITSSTTAGGVFNTPFSYTITAINDPTTFSAAGLPPGLGLDIASGVISGTPTAAGTYSVTLGASNAAGTGTETLWVTINPAPVAITLPGASGPFGPAIQFAYDGAEHEVEPSTVPAIPVTVTYNGSTTPPRLPGTYKVVATPADSNYAGSAEATLEITVTALVRKAPTLNGDLDGSLQLLTGESFVVNSNGSASGDLLVPGTPMVQLNGSPIFAGVADAAGAVAPSNYSLTLNNGSVVRYIVRRVDPLTMPAVAAPTLPTGTRNVTLDKPGQSLGDPATLRNLTLNAKAGTVTLPAGVYGDITANGSAGFVLGVAGATEPAVYELQTLNLSRQASVEIVGPVILKLASGLTLDGTLGSANHPDWLELLIANGGLSLNNSAKLHGNVTAPNGTVTINGALHGRVSADRLVINGTGLIEDPSL
jgi:endoglucanase